MAIKKFRETSINDIISLEQRFNVILPQDYIDFLLQYNGGNVEIDDDCGIYVRYLKEYIHVDVLFGLDTGYQNANIDTWMSDNIIASDMPENTIIIGDSIEHGFIVLLCAGEDAGVYYWDHAYEFKCSNDESNTYFIADTFTDFAKGLL
jgi:hypothetical protein